MKIDVVCMGKGSTVKSLQSGEIVMYYVDFSVVLEANPQNQKVVGSLHLKSQEPFDYVEKSEYSLDLANGIALVSPHDAKKAGIIH